MSFENMLDEIAKGCSIHFEQLYKQLRQPMIAYATGLLAGDYGQAEDAVDEAFMQIWQGADRFSRRGSAKGWVRSIVRNKAIDSLRRRGGREVNTAPEALPETVFEGEDQESRVIRRQAALELRQAMGGLSTEQREAVHLCYFEGLSIAEIAEASDCPQNTVKTRLFYARRQMQHVLQDAGWMDAIVASRGFADAAAPAVSVRA